jgi:hypothetical protein
MVICGERPSRSFAAFAPSRETSGNLQASSAKLQRRSNLQSSISKGRSVIRVMLKSVMVELEVVSLELLWMLEVGI